MTRNPLRRQCFLPGATGGESSLVVSSPRTGREGREAGESPCVAVFLAARNALPGNGCQRFSSISADRARAATDALT